MTEYERAVEELRGNAEQWTAFESMTHCVTLAGPGSGKTKVLTTKMARLLRETVRAPRGIACVTYNNECARELERRLWALGVADASNIFVGTLHRFCLRHVLRPLARVAEIKVPHPVAVASERAQSAALEQAMENAGVRGIRVSDFRTHMDKFRRTAIDRAEGIDGWETGDNGLTDVVGEYERLLRDQGQLDFDDIVLLSVRAVEGSETVRRCLKAKFPVLLVDEYQDLGVPLHRMVLALGFKAGVRIFAVGDPDQSIYGFTGARPDLLGELAARSDVEQVSLRVNYRSGRQIVAAAALALGEQRSYKAHSNSDGAVECKQCHRGLEEQVQHVVETVIPSLIKKGDRYGDIGLLYPTQQEGDELERGLVAANIPFARLDKGGGYRRTPFIRLIEDFAAWCLGGWRAGSPSLSQMLVRWRATLGVVDDRVTRSSRATLVRFLFDNRDPSGACGDWLERLNKAVVESIEDRLRQADNDELEAFTELLRVTGNKGPLAMLDVATFAGKSTLSERVCVMNLHTSKGSEFNAVVLVGMDKGRMPIYHATTEAALAEQRRLFFVGVSRARREVHLTYSGWTMNQYGRRFDDGPSPFLLDLQKGLALLRTKGR